MIFSPRFSRALALESSPHLSKLKIYKMKNATCARADFQGGGGGGGERMKERKT